MGPMAVHVSFQLSAVLQPDPAFPLLQNINGTKLVPLFWASEGFSSPSSWMVSTKHGTLSSITWCPGDFNWSPSAGRRSYTHHTCHGGTCKETKQSQRNAEILVIAP